MRPTSIPSRRNLRRSLVMPAYDEERMVGTVVREWHEELQRLGMPYEMRLYDDGPHDRRTGRGSRSSANVRLRPSCQLGPRKAAHISYPPSPGDRPAIPLLGWRSAPW